MLKEHEKALKSVDVRHKMSLNKAIKKSVVFLIIVLTEMIDKKNRSFWSEQGSSHLNSWDVKVVEIIESNSVLNCCTKCSV